MDSPCSSRNPTDQSVHLKEFSYQMLCKQAMHDLLDGPGQAKKVVRNLRIKSDSEMIGGYQGAPDRNASPRKG
jgi:hypothetical protein